MITVTLNDIRASQEGFSSIMGQQMPARTAYKVAKIAKALDVEYNMLLDGQRKLVDKYSEKDEGGNPIVLNAETGSIKIQSDKVQECNEELAALLGTEVEINANKLSFEEIEALEISPSLLATIMPFIEE